MKIVVITPMRNAEETILTAINSVKNQEVNSQVIHYIFDDASEDRSYDIVSRFPEIKLFKTDKRSGQSNGRNKLIEEALKENVDYIAFLDSDDEWTKDHLSSSLEMLNPNLMNPPDIVFSTPIMNDKNNNAMVTSIPIPNIFIGKHLEYGNYIYISSIVSKPSLFKNNKFDSELDSIEDYDMWFRLYKQGYKFDKVPNFTTIYRVNPNGEAGKANSKILQFRAKHNLNFNPKLNLHLACGMDYQSDYINIDLYPTAVSEVAGKTEYAKIDAKFDVSSIPYPDNTIDTIRALHIIEHFDFHEGVRVLKEWNRVLKPGGKLIIETPDLLGTCKRFVEDPPFRIPLYGQFFAHPWIAGQTHKFLFTEEQLVCNLGWAGFKNFKRISPISNYVNNNTVDIFLAMEAYK